MSDLLKISHLVETHFPAFYREEGKTFVAFVKAYYEWLEQPDNPVGASRQLLNMIDVDKSVDSFIANFKQKYLVNFPLVASSNTTSTTTSNTSSNVVSSNTATSNTAANTVNNQQSIDQATFIKKASELYRSKGSQRAVELLFRLLFNEDIEVYYPTSDIFRPSTGKWMLPVYIELSQASKNNVFPGNIVKGQTSGATAVVARVAKRTMSGKTFDVAYLTNIEGNFKVGEIVTYDGLIEGSPTIIGSLNEIVIENPGQNFEIGDVVSVLSDATGRHAKARVLQIVPATGKIDYKLVDGGSGYIVGSNVAISNKVLTIDKFVSNTPYTTSFREEELVQQRLTYVPFTAASGSFDAGHFVYGIDTAQNPDLIISAGYVLEKNLTTSTTGWVLVNELPVRTINLSSISNGNTTGSFNVGEIVYQIKANTNFRKTTGYVLKANSTVALIDATFGDYTTGERLIGVNSGCSANISSQSTVNGSFNDPNIDTIQTGLLPSAISALVVTNNIEDRSASGRVIGSNTNYLGLYNVDASKAFKVGPHAYVYAVGSNSHANVLGVSTGSVGGFDVGSITDEEQIYINTDIIGSNNSANVPFLSMTIDGDGPTWTGNGISSNVGFVGSVTVTAGGSGYTNTDIVSDPWLGTIVTFNGGSPTSIANAYVRTNSSGVITSVTVTNIGSGYDSRPTITLSHAGPGTLGTNAVLEPQIDPGYGFIKNPNGDLDSVIDTCLTKLQQTVGTIASLTNIDPGSNNTASPFVRIINPATAGFGKRNYKLNISGNTKPFLVGENLTQLVYDPVVTINATNMSGAFNAGQRETIKQVRGDGNTVYGELLTATYNSSTQTGVLRIRVEDVSNTFNTSNTFSGLTSTSTAQVGSKTTSTVSQLAKGRVIANDGASVNVFRTRFNTSFANNNQIFGETSGAQATINSIVDIPDSPIYGKNAIIDSPARSAQGTIGKVEVIDSGFAYTNSEIVTLKSNNNVYVATGVAKLIRQGTGEGYWEDNGGFASSDKIIQDSDYYQDFSYEVRSSLSLDRYADIIKDTVHIAGRKLFGSVERSVTAIEDIASEDLLDRSSTLVVSGGNNVKFNLGEELIEFDGTTKTANGTLDSIICYIGVTGANTEVLIGNQLSYPTFFSNTSSGNIIGATYDYNANTTTIAVNNVSGLFPSVGQVQTRFDRTQLAYTLTSFAVGSGDPINFQYQEVVYQSNGTANVGVGNITSSNGTHLIVKPATKLLVSHITGTVAAGQTIYQRDGSSLPNSAVGVVGMSNSTVIEVIDPRGQFVSGKKVFTASGNASILAIGGKSSLFTRSNTVVLSIGNLSDIGFQDGEILRQPSTGAQGYVNIGNTSTVSVGNTSGTFNPSSGPVIGMTSGVQATVSRVNGPFSIYGATSGANAVITAIEQSSVVTTLTIDSGIGALNTFGVANVSGQFLYNSTVLGANSSANATIVSVEIQAY